jgi:integral membrane protein (TIGR01906 family)
MKAVMSAARYLFIICLPFLLLTVVIAAAVNSSWLYTHGFQKYDVRQALADNGLYVTGQDMVNISHGFIHYWNSGEKYINLTVQQQGKSVAIFNQDEILHFRDVKSLFRLDYDVLLGTLLYCLIFSLVCIYREKGKYRKRLARAVLWGSSITLGVMFAAGLGTLINFDKLFYDFHLLVFNNNFWSTPGNMLLLFPDGFWYDAVTYIVVAIALLTVILIGLAWSYLETHKDKNRLLQP